ncbi:carboxyl-terminal protease [Candidatus Koribacter versatilis Ellin345]|uniref:Carboxyl-terminal protease n=1 Tax=Koribacter versatilis (strain Ellin345) TaxID=204669 RepID=Q1IN73_KORVE|nr:S41 family peptidase [Candidatus Koribacter versatilis]ABF41677.1 carboxyl-terminal protease [Candidatus Koribacter versatilis Ellin345]
MRSSRRTIFLVVLILLACGCLGMLFGQKITGASDNEIRDDLRTFSSVYDVVEQNYAEPVSADKAIYNGAIPGMLRVLDPHSNFFDPKQYALLREEQRGKYYGVGMQVGPRNNKVIVIAPFAGAPAYRAGIRPGDVIIAVDGKPTDNMSTSDVADLLKGPKGTTVRIAVIREGSEKPLEFSVIRDEIPRYSVDVHFMIRPGIGYMHVSGFQETTEHEVQEALDQMGDLKGLILDLRQNPGGLLSEGVGVADKFLKKGQVIVSHHGRSSPEKIYRAPHGNNGRDYPLVVLVNRGTASAAEIVSGAIQDHDRGLIAGETTFGKGLVQTVYPLSENTGLALTTAHYYTPSGRLIQREYAGVSLYDYYYNPADNDNNANKEVKLTDSGRTVYGGGGITPDVKIAPQKGNPFQDRLLIKYAFFNFSKHYMALHHTVDKGFNVDDAVMQEFRKFLDEQKIAFNEAELKDNDEWIRGNIKAELFVNQFGAQEGLRVHAETDPMVLKGLDLLPQAKQLADNARKTIAEKSAGTATASGAKVAANQNQ